MDVLFHTLASQNIAEISTLDTVLIHTAQDALELMHDPALDGARKIMLHKNAIHPDFYRLETGLAGEIVQKFVNYGVQLAIVGDFTQETSLSLQAFIRESNRGRHLFFAEDVEGAKEMLFGA